MNDKNNDNLLNFADEFCSLLFEKFQDKTLAIFMLNSLKYSEREKFVEDFLKSKKTKLEHMIPEVKNLSSKLIQNPTFREIFELKIQEYADKSAKKEVEENLESKGIEKRSYCTIS